MRLSWFVLCVLAFALTTLRLPGEQVLLRAGTLIECTLDEPGFSSATAEVGEPLLCEAGPVRSFGRVTLARESFFVGRLADYKNPGRWVGKGWIELKFDRLALPEGEMPVATKIVAVRGFKIDQRGRIRGKGRATRDAILWSIPVFWPWKLITLPGRGPKPTLEGEVPVTLRLLEDVSLPVDPEPGLRPPR